MSRLQTEKTNTFPMQSRIVLEGIVSLAMSMSMANLKLRPRGKSFADLTSKVIIGGLSSSSLSQWVQHPDRCGRLVSGFGGRLELDLSNHVVLACSLRSGSA